MDYLFQMCFVKNICNTYQGMAKVEGMGPIKSHLQNTRFGKPPKISKKVGPDGPVVGPWSMVGR